MLLFALFALLIFTVSCCNLALSRLGLWQVMRCDTVSRTAEALNVTQDDIKSLNPSLISWFVTPGEIYTVPYQQVVSPPATWFTTRNCTPILHLGYTECGQWGSTETTIPKTDTQLVTQTAPSKGHVSPTVILATPSPASSPLCYHGGEHANEEDGAMEFFAGYACKVVFNNNLTFKDERDKYSFLTPSWTGCLYHYFEIEWEPGCQNPQNVAQNCSQIMYRNWKTCKSSRGGFSTFGCLKYGYEALNDSHEISCPTLPSSCTVAY
ncbi:hypothetical protein GGI35DRAFT_463832 [Trichoderma velutinum]